jgi:HTH-type transcriptional regulator / antitoxin HigA
MSESVKNQYTPDLVTPPGETLLEVLESRGMSQAELADRTGRPTKTINEIIKGKAAITPETAIQFEFVLGIPASFWNNRERHYREFLARKKELERLDSQTDWLDSIPYKAMAAAGWIPPSTDRSQRLINALMFFGVASPSSFDQLWRHQHVAFKQSTQFQIDTGAVTAWLRKGELEAQRITCKEYDAARFREALIVVRSLTRELPNNFCKIIVDECSRAGVCVVFVPELPRTRVWGATRWLTGTCALIQLSLRYKSDDHLWFTFFHEAAHVVLHGKRHFFIDRDDQTSDNKEVEADAFARDWLIPPDDYQKFKRRGALSCAAIRRFAYQLGIADGIIVGRLQHDHLLPHTHCNELKKALKWASNTD